MIAVAKVYISHIVNIVLMYYIMYMGSWQLNIIRLCIISNETILISILLVFNGKLKALYARGSPLVGRKMIDERFSSDPMGPPWAPNPWPFGDEIQPIFSGSLSSAKPTFGFEWPHSTYTNISYHIIKEQHRKKFGDVW